MSRTVAITIIIVFIFFLYLFLSLYIGSFVSICFLKNHLVVFYIMKKR